MENDQESDAVQWQEDKNAQQYNKLFFYKSFSTLTSAKGLCGVFSKFKAIFASAFIVANEQWLKCKATFLNRVIFWSLIRLKKLLRMNGMKEMYIGQLVEQ